MPIQFACPYCHTPYTVNDRAAGSEVGCAACGQKILVPASTPLPANPPAAGPVVVYIPPAEEVADYRSVPHSRPRRERYYVREEVHVVHEERGTFGSAFGRTMGVMTAILLVGFLAVAALAGMCCLLSLPGNVPR